MARVDDPGLYDTPAAYERDVLGIHALLCASRLVSGELLRMLTGGDCRDSFSLAGGALHKAPMAWHVAIAVSFVAINTILFLLLRRAPKGIDV